MNITGKLGNVLRQLRNEQELTQEQVAEKANLHPKYIGAVERGERNLTIKNLAKISTALETELLDIFKYLSTSRNQKQMIIDEWMEFLTTLKPNTSRVLLKIVKKIVSLP